MCSAISFLGRPRLPLLLGIAAAGIVACETGLEPEQRTEPPPNIPLGRYVLVSRGGEPLPSTLGSGGTGSTFRLVADTLRLFANRSFTRAHHVAFCNSGVCSTIPTPSAGSFRVDSTAVILESGHSDCQLLSIVPASSPARLECPRFGLPGIYERDSGGG